MQEHDASTFDGFSAVCGKLGVMVGTMRIHPSVAQAMIRFLELQLSGLMVAKDKFPNQQNHQHLDLSLVLQKSRELIDVRPPMLTIVPDQEDDV
jgi:hypothetical protein